MTHAKDRYDGIFLPDPLPHYKNDESRVEDADGSKAIHAAIVEAYLKFGYAPITVPVLSPEERVQFITNHI
jgi:predicted ATPase